MAFNFTVKNQAEGRKVVLSIVGAIVASEYWNDETGEDVVRQKLESYALTEQDTLVVSINSPGGNYFAGVAIHSLLSDLPCKVITKNVGLCASAATLPFMAGSERIVYPGTSFMVHDPLTDAHGNADSLRVIADRLDEICESAKGIYLNHGVNAEKLVELMKSESLMTPDQAVENGFATSKVTDMEVTNCFTGKDISNAAKMAFGKPKEPEQPKKMSFETIYNRCEEIGSPALVKLFAGKDFTESEINDTLSGMVEVKNICTASGVESDEVIKNYFDTPSMIRNLVSALLETTNETPSGDLDKDINSSFEIKPYNHRN